jgi:hypothetical protein
MSSSNDLRSLDCTTSLSSSVEFTDSSRKSLARCAADYFGMPRPTEFIVAVALFMLLIVLKIVSLFHQSFDSDEPQHLHVIWSWTRGLIQYRDIFDNHMPLFHIMFARRRADR